jgi:hypothetical protein
MADPVLRQTALFDAAVAAAQVALADGIAAERERFEGEVDVAWTKLSQRTEDVAEREGVVAAAAAAQEERAVALAAKEEALGAEAARLDALRAAVAAHDADVDQRQFALHEQCSRTAVDDAARLSYLVLCRAWLEQYRAVIGWRVVAAPSLAEDSPRRMYEATPYLTPRRWAQERAARGSHQTPVRPTTAGTRRPQPTAVARPATASKKRGAASESSNGASSALAGSGCYLPFTLATAMMSRKAAAALEECDLYVEGSRATHVAGLAAAPGPQRLFRGHALFNVLVSETEVTCVPLAHCCPVTATVVDAEKTGKGHAHAVRLYVCNDADAMCAVAEASADKAAHRPPRPSSASLRSSFGVADNTTAPVALSATAATVALPLATGTFTVEIDYASKVMVLRDESGDTIARDARWSLAGVSAPADRLRVGVTLTVPCAVVDVSIE